jgi:hypothetical protein
MAILLWFALALLSLAGLAAWVVVTFLEDAWHPPRTQFEEPRREP